MLNACEGKLPPETTGCPSAPLWGLQESRHTGPWEQQVGVAEAGESWIWEQALLAHALWLSGLLGPPLCLAAATG